MCMCLDIISTTDCVKYSKSNRITHSEYDQHDLHDKHGCVGRERSVANTVTLVDILITRGRREERGTGEEARGVEAI